MCVLLSIITCSTALAIQTRVCCAKMVMNIQTVATQRDRSRSRFGNYRGRGGRGSRGHRGRGGRGGY